MNFLKYDEVTKKLKEIEVEEKDIMKSLQNEVQCRIVEFVRFQNGILAWVDEEAFMTNRFNNINCIIESKVKHELAGNIVFTGLDEENQEIIGLSDEQKKYINSLEIVGK